MGPQKATCFVSPFCCLEFPGSFLDLLTPGSDYTSDRIWEWKRSWPNLRYWPNVCTDRLKKKKKLSEDRCSTGQDLKLEPAAREAAIPPTRTWCYRTECSVALRTKHVEKRPAPLRVQSVTVNPLTPNDHYSGRTAPLTSKGFILYIYSTNVGTEYFKHGIHSSFFPLQNAVCFIILTYLVLYYSHFIYRLC